METIVPCTIIIIVIIGTIFMALSARKEFKERGRNNTLREIRKQRDLIGRRKK